MALPSGAALLPAERRAVASLAAIYAVRLLGLFLLLPVLALHAGSLPGGTPLLAGLAVGAYGLTQAVMQIPFGVWSDRIGRKPLIVVGLLLHVAGSALGAVASSAAALVAARVVQGLGAVSGPVTAFLADLTRPESRTRAMFAIGISIGASFVLSLVAGPLLAAAIGVAGVFWLIGALGIVALGLVLFVLPAERPAVERVARGHWRQALTRRLAPYYAGIFVLHLTLTAAFIAVPHVLRDLHGLEESSPLDGVPRRVRGLDCADHAARSLVGAKPQPGTRGAGRRRRSLRRPGSRSSLRMGVSMRCSVRWCSTSAHSISWRPGCRRP